MIKKMGPKKSPKKAKAAPPTIEAVSNTLHKLHELIRPRKDGYRAKPGDDLNTEALTRALDLLKTAVDELSRYVQREDKEKADLTTKVRINEDEVDTQKLAIILL